MIAPLLAALALAFAATAPPDDKLSPFTGVRANGPEYEVEVDEAWYRLVSLDGLAAADIRAHCDATYGARSEKRFAEDLVEVLAGMGHEHDGKVDLVLVSLESGERVELADVPMTEANRRRVWEARNRQDAEPAPVERIEREHALEVPEAYASLARASSWEGWSAGPKLTRSQAEEDLDQLEWVVQHAYSYRDLTGVDVTAAFDALRLGLPDEVPLGLFATRLEELLALFGDGHARVRGVRGHRVPGYAPFLLGDAREGVVAFLPDRSAFLDPERPLVRSIDGRSVDEWLAALAPLAGAVSPTWRRALGFDDLRWLNHARWLAGDALAPEVELVLVDGQGEEPRALRLTLAEELPSYGAWPPLGSRMLEGGTGYLRIAEMSGDADFLAAIEAELERFAGARALVIDVRGNGGGTRDVLRLIAPRLLAADAQPLVANVAAYRLRPGEEAERAGGYLEDRFLYPISYERWTPPERRVISRCAQAFRPDWTPVAEFSAWHAMAIPPAPEGVARFHDRPVLVLQDEFCYSATDVFLGALSELPNVTLVGARSGGGSGRSKPTELAHSRLEVRLSTMASFRPSGQRYDGKGVAPDVEARPRATDFLEGGTDAVLEAALELVR